MGYNPTQNYTLKGDKIIFLLTDPTLISINHIQKAQKQADSGFNDAIAQLYQETFKTQEKAKEEHIKQAKEKALELQRVEEEARKKAEQEAKRVREEQHKATLEAERAERERQEASARETQNNQANTAGERLRENSISSQSSEEVIRSSWAEVSPEQASQYMANKTGVSASTWQGVIFRESSNNPYALNSLGCFGYLQIMQSVHGNVSTWTPQAYLDKAVEIYQSSGSGAWEAW